MTSSHDERYDTAVAQRPAPRVAIVHDYLTQRGGAERVVLSMSRALPDAPIYTTLYNPDTTYPEFRQRQIITSPLNRIWALRRDHRMALPLLPWAASRLTPDADVVLTSSSGWAHGARTNAPTIVYCHAPARWVYQSEVYLGGPMLRSPIGWALALMRPGLRRWDRRAARSADVYLANSRVVQARIEDAYARNAEVLAPPHTVATDGPLEPITAVSGWADEGYALVVSRLLPYKNVQQVIRAMRGRADRLLIVGDGPLWASLRANAPDNVRLVRELTDAQMRWAYTNARLLVAPSHEDFGLTPLEAAAFGVPTVALRAGGYLDTIDEEVNGIFFSRPTPADIAMALDRAAERAWDREAIMDHAEYFNEARFHERLHQIVAQQASSSSRRGDLGHV